MKLHLDNNVVEGTPEELVTYLQLTEGKDESDLGEFYAVNVDNSALSKGTILKKTGKHSHEDSVGGEYIYVDGNALEHIDKHQYQLEDRFNFATQIGIRLLDITDLARETEGCYFKVTEPHVDLSVGDVVTITKDDKDNDPQCKDKYGNFSYVYLRDLELVQDTFKGLTGSLSIDKSSIGSTESSTDEEGFSAGNYSILSPEAQEPSTDIQVGDRVKILKIEAGAEGEATVTAVLEDGNVELEGIGQDGIYLTNWSNHVSNLEKIEAESLSLEDKSIEQVVEDLLLYEFYEVVDPEYFASSIKKGTILKRTSNTYTDFDLHYIKLVTSKGLGQKGQLRDSVIKPVLSSHIKERFEFAEQTGVMLTVDTDFGEECKGSLFKVTKDKEESGSRFEKGAIVKLGHDDGSRMPSFYDKENNQYVYLGAVKEIARPRKDK